MNIRNIPQRLTRKAILAAPSLVAWSHHRLELTMKRSREMAEGFLNTGLTASELEEFTLWCYQTNYHPNKGYSQKLFDWEIRCWDQHLTNCRKVLVLAAGRGREVSHLDSRGIDVWATEPNYAASKACEAVLKNKAKLSNATFREFALHGPAIWSPSDVLPEFDAVIVGWGSLSHCFGTELRRDLFRQIARLCPKGPILASFWTQDSGSGPKRGRAFDAGLKIGHWTNVVTRQDSDEHLHRFFAPHLGVALAFEKAELDELADIANREVIEVSKPGTYPHVVMR